MLMRAAIMTRNHSYENLGELESVVTHNSLCLLMCPFAQLSECTAAWANIPLASGETGKGSSLS